MSDTEQPDNGATVEHVESPEMIAEEQIKYKIVNVNSGLEELNHVINSGDKEAIREAYGNLTFTFPTANVIWYSWAQFEYLNQDFAELEALFTRCLRSNLSVPLWRLYLSYVKNQQLPGIEDESEARQTMLKAYDFAVSHIGFDVASGPVWAEYIDYCQSNYYRLVKDKVTTWEQQNLMDLTRKVYHRALIIPMAGLEELWHAYDAYENSLNKLTAKKLVAEKSSAYMAARSATKELMDLMAHINLDDYPLDPLTEMSVSDRKNRLASWMRWIEWEKSNPLTLSNRSILHSRIIYAFRRALMSCRQDPLLWSAYATYLRFDVNRLEDAETVLKQACKYCPLSSNLVLSLMDLKEAQSAEFDSIKQIVDQFLVACDSELDKLKTETIALRRTPLDTNDESVFIDAILDRNCAPVEAYLQLQDGFNSTQVALIDLARRLSGLTAARAVFAAARKSVHVSAAVFAAAASLEFRIRKDATIAVKIYELGLTRFPNDWSFSRGYLNFLLAQNDDANVRALFERIISNIENFRATHSHEVIAKNVDVSVITGIWRDFYAFEKEIGDYQSFQKFEERMRSALADDPSLKPDCLLHDRLGILRLEDFLMAPSEDDRTDDQQFTLPRIREKQLIPFHLGEPLFNLVLKISEALSSRKITYDGPGVDASRFISFIERVNLPSLHHTPSRRMQADRPRPRESHSGSHLSRRRYRDFDEDRERDRRDHDRDERNRKQARTGIFEERRRY